MRGVSNSHVTYTRGAAAFGRLNVCDVELDICYAQQRDIAKELLVRRAAISIASLASCVHSTSIVTIYCWKGILRRINSLLILDRGADNTALFVFAELSRLAHPINV